MVATNVNRNRLGSTSVSVFKLTCDATATLKIKMKNVPASKVRLRLRTLGWSEARMENKLMLNINTDWKTSLGKRHATPAPKARMTIVNKRLKPKLLKLSFLKSPKNNSAS